ncbi:extracellular solute-binding protein [Paenibacillus qinlingensis]|uniref:Multiple sugar transport system substrate-binding protein n=1 Tax=Paenibacillus qinlingensis TaxID=1837343 RepID=A0ABU1NSX6_9BACL|nr:extracellular solute-binding protein [Paenibacillus qinlingensis]MDR6550538.1 multiple sugar transport system substrate-binding protein [Paenibacillus qinlingensis]
MKKITRGSSITSLVLATMMIAGCGSSGSTGNSQTSSQPEAAKSAAPAATTAAPAAADKAAKISWWGAWNEDQGPGDMIKEFNKKFPNIKVEYVKFANTDEGNVKVDTSLIAGQEMDVFFNYGVPRVEARAKKKLLQDLTEFISKDKFDVEAELGKEIYKQDGKYFGLPVSSLTDSVFINKKLLDEAGLPVPKSWSLDEYKEYAKKLTKGDGPARVYGTSDFHSLYYWTMPVRSVLGTNAWYNKDGASNFDYAGYKKALEFKFAMENVDKIQYPYTEIKSTKAQVFDLFMQKKTAMAVASNAISRFIGDTTQYPRDFITTVAPLPTLEKDQKQNLNNGLHYFGYLSMNPNTKEKEASWQFMKWLATEGSIHLAKVGHIPTWKKTNKDALVKVMFGEDADKKIDLEAFKRVVLDYDSVSYNDTIFTGYAELNKLLQDEAEKALFGVQKIDEALANMKKKSDEAIKNSK